MGYESMQACVCFGPVWYDFALALSNVAGPIWPVVSSVAGPIWCGYPHTYRAVHITTCACPDNACILLPCMLTFCVGAEPTPQYAEDAHNPRLTYKPRQRNKRTDTCSCCGKQKTPLWRKGKSGALLIQRLAACGA